MAGHWDGFRKVFRWVPKRERIPLNEDQLRKIFLEHDKNGDGHLDKAELRAAFGQLGARVPRYRADRAIRYADIDGDEVIHGEHEIDHLVSYAMDYRYTFK